MAHCNTVFLQLLKIVGRREFEAIASLHHQGQSLRDIETNLQAQRQHSYHLGSAPIARSSLARLNNQQPASCYEALFYRLMSAASSGRPSTAFALRIRFMRWMLLSLIYRSSFFPGRTTRWEKAP
ncbi:hypothetical protein SAMN05216315_13732 [Nitrosospira sp. Nsp18]|nr:hypothetical protein SAMN05216315_13732 [Nitrosospira sp. Nsp18]